jgi:hypothetical protein
MASSCGKKMMKGGMAYAKGGMADVKGRAMKGGSADRIGRAVMKDRRDPDIGKMMKEAKVKAPAKHNASGMKKGGEMMVSPRKRMAMGKGK